MSFTAVRFLAPALTGLIRPSYNRGWASKNFFVHPCGTLTLQTRSLLIIDQCPGKDRFSKIRSASPELSSQPIPRENVHPSGWDERPGWGARFAAQRLH